MYSKWELQLLIDKSSTGVDGYRTAALFCHEIIRARSKLCKLLRDHLV